MNNIWNKNHLFKKLLIKWFNKIKNKFKIKIIKKYSYRNQCINQYHKKWQDYKDKKCNKKKEYSKWLITKNKMI